MSDFAEHWAARMMPEMRRKARLEAIRIVTAEGTDDENWDTFNAALAGLEREAHRLGASHMPDRYQIALHIELRRELVESISAVLVGRGEFLPWHVASGVLSTDCWRLERQIREWAGFIEPDRNPEG